MEESAQVGRKGEDLATDFLERKGYKILFRNWKMPRWGEIDIVALHEGNLVFAEVKTRSTLWAGEPLEAVNFHKLQSLRRAALYFKNTYPQTPESLRVDVLSVLLTDPPSIEHLENIYEDSLA